MSKLILRKDTSKFECIINHNHNIVTITSPIIPLPIINVPGKYQYQILKTECGKHKSTLQEEKIYNSQFLSVACFNCITKNIICGTDSILDMSYSHDENISSWQK